MPKFSLTLASLLLPIIVSSSAGSDSAVAAEKSSVQTIVDEAVRPVLSDYRIPGMAVAVTLNGEKYFCNYGSSSKEKTQSIARPQSISEKTLFEIGSISKTFTATLASWAQARGSLALSAPVSKYMPSLRNSSFDQISLLNLATYTAGGLPLQMPDTVNGVGQIAGYFKKWQPVYPAGTHRMYSNPSIGLLGMIAAESIGSSYDDAIEKQLFPALGMTNSFIRVPPNFMNDYAQGYAKDDSPVRLHAGALSSETYGVKSCTADMIRFVEANMRKIELSPILQQSIDATHTGYYSLGEFTQDLVWEQYSYPVEEQALLDGNSLDVIYNAKPAKQLMPPLPPQACVFINKTGSTNGFSAYVAFIPVKKIGVVILANKSYPIADRVRAAYQILNRVLSVQ